MLRHELDLMSLLAGLFFTLIGLGVILSSVTSLRVDAEWLLAVVLIAVGLTGLASSFVAARRESSEENAIPDDPADA